MKNYKMKNIISKLENAITERFKCVKAIEALQDLVKANLEAQVLEQYQGTKIKRGKYHYELFMVKGCLDTNWEDVIMEEPQITLYYIITSKLEDKQQQALDKLKKYDPDMWYACCPKKEEIGVKLYIAEEYEISIDEIIEEDINLLIVSEKNND